MTITQPQEDHAPPTEPDGGRSQEKWPCSWHGCQDEAVYAVTFVDQRGHIHDCIAHTAILMSHSNVEQVVRLPCPMTHGSTWTDVPRDWATDADPPQD